MFDHVEEDKGRARSFVEPNHSLKINCGNSKKYPSSNPNIAGLYQPSRLENTTTEQNPPLRTLQDAKQACFGDKWAWWSSW